MGVTENVSSRSSYFWGNSVVGLCFTTPNSTTAYHAGYQNVHARMGSGNQGVWWYSLAAGSSVEQRESIGLRKSWGSFDLYGFYPYSNTINNSNLDKIPYDATSSTDYMYAKKTGIDPNVTAQRNIDLPFQHVMTAFVLRFKLKYVGSVHLTKVVFSFDDATNNKFISTKGTYSAIDGTVTPDPDVANYTNTMTRTVNDAIPIGVNYLYCYFIFPAIKAPADANFTVTVYLNNGQTGGTELMSGTFHGKLSDLDSQYRMLQGYSYSYDVLIDNYIKFSSTPTIGQWTDGETKSVDI
jgi:hypothetical protein